MIPLFKSTFSIGKSILTLSDPEKDISDGPDSIFSIVEENNLKTLYLVEDTMIGFFNAVKKSKAMGVQLVFGYRFTCCNDPENPASFHKLVVFAKNDAGCKALNKFYSFVNTDCNGVIKIEDVVSRMTDNLLLAVPFYDSFIFNNHLFQGNCMPDFKDLKLVFFVEQNNLPFDSLIEKEVRKYAGDKHEVELSKSIYYRHKDDIEAFQTYKIVCGRFAGRQSTLSSPNLSHCGSDEFCWESYMEKAS